MVDINLLDDDETPQYRPEKSEFQEPYDFEESSEETEEISGDEAWEEEPSEDDPVYGNYDTPRSKAFLYIAIPLVIIAIFAAIYIWQPFFKKGGETESTPMTQIDSAQEFTEESPEPEAAVSSEVTPMEAFTDNVTSLITQVSPGDKLLQFSYSAGKFYLELEVAVESTLQALLQEMQTAFPESEVALLGRNPTAPGDPIRGLFSGDLRQPDISDRMYDTRSVAADAYENEIRTMCERSGLSLHRVSTSRLVQNTGADHIPTRFSASGSQSAVLQFLRALSSEKIAMQFTRIIVTPARSGSAGTKQYDIAVFADLIQR